MTNTGKTFSFRSHGMTSEMILSRNYIEKESPAGGFVKGKGIDINWQDGPIDREAKQKPNGTLVEDVLEACKRRLEFYEESRFACAENRAAIFSIQQALKALLARRKDRAGRGVLGKHEV